jgi:hypothetical protein
MSKIACVNCRHKIDAAAKICPYCGSDPATGQKVVDTDALLQEMFTPRHVSASESVLEYARQRQGIVIAVSIVVLFLVFAALHQFVTMRNQSAVSASPPLPLTEVADLSSQPDETKPEPMPDLNFQYQGRPQAMRTFIVEQGAVTPPEVLAEQQAAAQGATATQPPAAQAGQPQPQPTTKPAPPAHP